MDCCQYDGIDECLGWSAKSIVESIKTLHARMLSVLVLVRPATLTPSLPFADTGLILVRVLCGGCAQTRPWTDAIPSSTAYACRADLCKRHSDEEADFFGFDPSSNFTDPISNFTYPTSYNHSTAVQYALPGCYTKNTDTSQRSDRSKHFPTTACTRTSP